MKNEEAGRPGCDHKWSGFAKGIDEDWRFCKKCFKQEHRNHFDPNIEFMGLSVPGRLQGAIDKFKSGEFFEE